MKSPVLLLILILSLACSQREYIQGQYFPQLAYPKGSGTILLFFMENMEYYAPKTEFLGEIENIERLIYRLKMDLNILHERYPGLRIVYVDVYQRRNVAIEYRVFDIPTVLLFDRMGYEVRRWTPVDYSRGGGSVSEMGRLIEKMNKVRTEKNEGK